MRPGNLNLGVTRLLEAFEELQIVWEQTQDEWNDENSRMLDQNCMAEIGPRIHAALDATNFLGEVVNRAARECGDEYSY